MIRVLHAADLHLDSPFRSLGPEKARLRRGEQRQMLARITEAAIEKRVDMVLFSGDLFDSENVFSDTGQMLEQALSSLEMPVFIAPGNHDRYGERSVWTRLTFKENVHIFTDEKITCVRLPELGVRVWGTAFTERYRRPPMEGFEAEKDGNTIDIMVLHGVVGDAASLYGAITEEQLMRCGMDYVALGHVHSFSGLRRAGDTWYAWPGCPEGRGFDETGEKGVILAEISESGCSAELLPMGGRRYESISVDLTDAEDIPAAVTAAIPADVSGDIYRIRLKGETESAPDMRMLQRMLEGRFFGLELLDETSPRRNIWRMGSSDSLKGIFLARLRQYYDDAADDDERERITQAVRWGLLAMENGEELPL